jgi:hypothetical protein
MNTQVPARESSPVSLGDWILTLIVLAIPLVGLIMLFVWGFSSSTNPSKRNYCQATLILLAVLFVLVILLGVMGGFAMLHGAHALDGGVS